ncbi:hypothetical protein [Gracilibacillus boraciitolerans]|nr:hypothetical protein [Gracilibacillus boraciitolerans]
MENLGGGGFFNDYMGGEFSVDNYTLHTRSVLFYDNQVGYNL